MVKEAEVDLTMAKAAVVEEVSATTEVVLTAMMA